MRTDRTERKMIRIVALTLVWALLLWFVQAQAQNGQVYHERISVTLDSTDTETVFLAFQGPGFSGVEGFTASAVNPKDQVQQNGDILVYGFVDSTLAGSHTDSLSVLIQPLTHDGYVIDSKTYVDFATNAAAATEKWLDWTPWNATARTLGASQPTFWAYLPAILDNFFGIKITLKTVTTGQNSQAVVKLDVAVRK